MKANFEISLPTIPGKNIRFKVQDIKAAAAFGTQKSRFPDNKAVLTKRFVESFHNFHEKKHDDETETQAESEASRVVATEKKPIKFRHIISDNKKFLLPIYNELMQEEKQKINASLEPKPPKDGYTFAKAGLEQKQQLQAEDEGTQRAKTKYRAQNLTDNYYFTSEIKIPPQQQQPKPKHMRPSAVFKNEQRSVVQDRMYKSVVPGPGTYLFEQSKPKSPQKRPEKPQPDDSYMMDYRRLKDVIAKVLVEENEQEQDEVVIKKEERPNHMFVQDDRDRFGQQIFPIAPKLKVPGPGAYEVGDSLEEQAKKLLLVEEQRKLLKEWFNN